MSAEITRYQRILETNNETMVTLARLYALVFTAPPWREVFACPECHRFYSPDFTLGQASPCCAQPLSDAYPTDKTITYIRDELTEPLAYAISCKVENETVAFGWGWATSVQKLISVKWPQDINTQTVILRALAPYCSEQSTVYYISELGVDQAFRRKGIGSQITRQLLNFGLGNKLSVITRTLRNSPMRDILMRLGMLEIIGPSLGQQDGINPNRVLFVQSYRSTSS